MMMQLMLFTWSKYISVSSKFKVIFYLLKIYLSLFQKMFIHLILQFLSLLHLLVILAHSPDGEE